VDAQSSRPPLGSLMRPAPGTRLGQDAGEERIRAQDRGGEPPSERPVGGAQDAGLPRGPRVQPSSVEWDLRELRAISTEDALFQWALGHCQCGTRFPSRIASRSMRHSSRERRHSGSILISYRP
jgi:hypothetical protein